MVQKTNSVRSGKSPSRKPKDYKIPGIRPTFYIPIFLLALTLWILFVPNWSLPGSSDGLLFIFFIGLMGAFSSTSVFVSHIWKRLRK